MERWEYKTIMLETKGFTGGILDQTTFENELNSMGTQGWELVSCFDTNQSYGASRLVFAVFKRKVSI